LHCACHFVVDESNQDPYKSGALLGTLNPGNLAPENSENPGNLEVWTGTLELGTPTSATLQSWKQLWNLGTLQNFGTLPDDIAALEPWNLLLGCKAGSIVL